MRDESRKGKPRVVEPQRRQGVIRCEMPEDKLPATHTARVLWDVIGALDLTAFLDGVKAIEGTVGRKTRSPQMKLTLWLYAISNGVGSAREIARLIGSDDGYRWIVGDLEVGHHTLSAFRVNLADGGFGPAYNVCIATAGSPLGGPRTIVGVQVTNVGSDMGSVAPMLAEIERRTGQLPKTLLADANHAAHGCIRAATEGGC